jgi:predicted transcriptional regulator
MQLQDYYMCKKVCRLDKDNTDMMLELINTIDDIEIGILYMSKKLNLNMKKVMSILNRVSKKNYTIKSITKDDSKYVITDSEERVFKIPIKFDNVPKDKYVDIYLTYDLLPDSYFKTSSLFNKLNATESENIVNIFSSPFVRNKHHFCSYSNDDKPMGSHGVLSTTIIKSNMINILYLVREDITKFYKPINECLASSSHVVVMILSNESMTDHPCYSKQNKGSYEVKDISRNVSNMKYLTMLSNRKDENVRKLDKLFD